MAVLLARILLDPPRRGNGDRETQALLGAPDVLSVSINLDTLGR
jgi:hypothetical protein